MERCTSPSALLQLPWYIPDIASGHPVSRLLTGPGARGGAPCLHTRS